MQSSNSQTTYQFESLQQSDLFYKIIHEIRCNVCQNQSLAESSAVFAVDLRNAIYQQVVDGKQEVAIRSFVSERYGDYASYRPPFQLDTLCLWFCPVILILVAIFILRKQYAA